MKVRPGIARSLGSHSATDGTANVSHGGRRGAPPPPSRTAPLVSRDRARPHATPSGTGQPDVQRPSTVAYATGDQVFSPETGSGLVYIIRSGCIRLYKVLPDGRSINVGLLGPNTIFVQEDLGDPMSTGATAEALVPTTLSIVGAGDLANLISESPELAAAVVAGMSRRLTELQTLVEHLLVRDTSVRLSVTLLNLAAKFGRPAIDHPDLVEITLPLTHQSLANMIGSNRVTVTRKLLDFQRDGVVRALGRNVMAIDVDALQAHATGETTSADAATAAVSGARGPSRA